MRSQTVAFRDDNPNAVTEFNSVEDPTFCGDMIEIGSLKDFLARPVKIHEVDIVEGSPSTLATIFPWQLFFTDATIRRKVDNYGLINCRLHIKAVVNASPFYYNAYLISYHPKIALCNGVTGPEPFSHVGHSQRPRIWIHAQDNQGGELILPFVHDKNWLELTKNQELLEMGALNLMEVVALQNSNGVAGGSINVQIYAWAEDVKMSAPTIALTAQGDEFGQGPVSRVASAIANVASKLTDVPYIQPFASATEIAASAVSKIGAIFGFTDVPVIADVMPVKNMPFQSMASAGIGEPATKLTIDPKNELCVDPRTVGLSGGDELAIKSLVIRESLLSVVNWSSTASSDSVLFACPVQPTLYESSSGTGQILKALVPMGLVAQCFRYWRGDIIFRFKVICSKYHRGRLRITWDPFGDIVFDDASTTTSFNKIVDISSGVDLEMRIKYSQALHWLKTITAEDLDANYQRKAGEVFVNYSSGEFRNGQLTVRVLNELSSPVASSDVQIMVFVRGCESLQFSSPDTQLTRRSSYYTVQGGNWTDPSSCEDITGEGGSTHPDAYRVYMGEAVGSMRSLMRRAVYAPWIGMQAKQSEPTSEIRTVNIYARRVPEQPGFVPGASTVAAGINTPAASFRCEFTRFTPLTLMMPCFMGYRGSFVWHYNLDTTSSGSASVSKFSALRENRPLPVDATGALDRVVLDDRAQTGITDSNVSEYYARVNENNTTGIAVTNTQTQTGLVIHYPHYYPNRFNGTSLGSWALGNTKDFSNEDRTRVSFEIHPAESLGGTITGVRTSVRDFTLERYSAIGTDFSLFFFLSVPTLFVYDSEPSAPESE